VREAAVTCVHTLSTVTVRYVTAGGDEQRIGELIKVVLDAALTSTVKEARGVA
jgi:hypothetical protein